MSSASLQGLFRSVCSRRSALLSAGRGRLFSSAAGAPGGTAVEVPRLHYFQFRGRALACRVALFNALGKDGWEDNRISLPRFKKAPKSPQNPDRVQAEFVTNNLPQLDLPCGTKVSLVGGIHLTYSLCTSSSKCILFLSSHHPHLISSFTALTTLFAHQVTQSHAIARFAAKLEHPAKLPTHFCPDLYPQNLKAALLVDEVIAIVDQILLLTPKDPDPEIRTKHRAEYHTSGFLRVGRSVAVLQ